MIVESATRRTAAVILKMAVVIHRAVDAISKMAAVIHRAAV